MSAEINRSKRLTIVHGFNLEISTPERDRIKTNNRPIPPPTSPPTHTQHTGRVTSVYLLHSLLLELPPFREPLEVLLAGGAVVQLRHKRSTSVLLLQALPYLRPERQREAPGFLQSHGWQHSCVGEWGED